MISPKVSIILVNGQPRVSSLDIAEKFGKPHADVLKAIRKLISELPEEFNEGIFSLVEYTDDKGEERPMHNLTRDAFSLLAMGFTGKKALAWKVKYIEAFNLMEAELLKRAEAGKSIAASQKRLSETDKYAAYLEEVEDFRAATATNIETLLHKGLELIDGRKLGAGAIIGFTPVILDWLRNVAAQPSPILNSREPVSRAIDYSPLYLIRHLEKAQSQGR